MKFLISTIVILAAIGAQAEVSPAYRALKKMDAAIEALSKGGQGLPTKNPEDVTVHSASLTMNKTTGKEIMNVDVGYNKCSVGLTTKAPPKGMAGASSFTGSVIACSKYMTIAAVSVMKYEEVRPVLESAAAKGITNLAFSVESSAQGPKVKLSASK